MQIRKLYGHVKLIIICFMLMPFLANAKVILTDVKYELRAGVYNLTDHPIILDINHCLNDSWIQDGDVLTTRMFSCIKTINVASVALPNVDSCPPKISNEKIAQATSEYISEYTIVNKDMVTQVKPTTVTKLSYANCEVIKTDEEKEKDKKEDKKEEDKEKKEKKEIEHDNDAEQKSVKKPSTKPVSTKIMHNKLVKPGTPEYSLAVALDNYCAKFSEINNPTSAQQDLFNRCLNLQKESVGSVQFQGLQEILAPEYVASVVSQLNFNRIVMSGVTERLATMRGVLSNTSETRSNNRLFQTDSAIVNDLLGIESEQQRGGAAGDINIKTNTDRWGVFLSGLNGMLQKNMTDNSTGFDNDTYSLTLGVDYLMNQDSYIGLAYGFGESDNDFSDASGYLNSRTHMLSFYSGKQFAKNLFLEGVFGYGISDYESQRDIGYIAEGESVEQSALANPEGSQFFASIGVTKSIRGWLETDIHARFNYLDAKIDRFSEEILYKHANGVGLALEVDHINAKSQTSDIGFNFSKPISRHFGVIVPYLNISWLHEFQKSSDNVQARFLHDPASINFTGAGTGNAPNVFVLPGESNDRDFMTIRLGTNVLLPRNITMSLGFNTTVGLSNYDQLFYSFNIRKSF